MGAECAKAEEQRLIVIFKFKNMSIQWSCALLISLQGALGVAAAAQTKGVAELIDNEVA